MKRSQASTSDAAQIDTLEADQQCDKLSSVKIDIYWAKVLQMKNVLGQHKYKTLGKVIMACLALSHGNADAERSFSSNKRTVTPERVSLCKGSISAVHLVKDAIRRAPGGSATTVAITPALLRSSHSAYARYKQHLEEERRAVEIRRQQMSDKKKQKLEEETKRKEQKAKEEENRRKRRSEQKDEEDMLTAESKQRIILQGSGNLLKEAESKTVRGDTTW